jgi:hypothetical protein
MGKARLELVSHTPPSDIAARTCSSNFSRTDAAPAARDARFWAPALLKTVGPGDPTNRPRAPRAPQLPGMAHSLPFVEWDPRRKRFSVNEDAAAYLGTLDERIGS